MCLLVAVSLHLQPSLRTLLVAHLLHSTIDSNQVTIVHVCRVSAIAFALKNYYINIPQLKIFKSSYHDARLSALRGFRMPYGGCTCNRLPRQSKTTIFLPNRITVKATSVPQQRKEIYFTQFE